MIRKQGCHIQCVCGCKAGDDLVPGGLLGFEDWPHRVAVEQVPNPCDIVFTANRHYDRPAEAPVPVLQLTWDDRGGRFPWEEGYASRRPCSRDPAHSAREE